MAVGFFIAIVVTMVTKIISSDFLHTNMHRTKENALFMMFVIGPIIGLLAPIAFGFLPLLSA